MADGMPLPPPPPSHKSRRIHHHHHRREGEGEGFTDSDVAAAHQLIQLSDDSDEDKRKLARDGGSSSVGGGGVDLEVSSARIEAVFDRERGDRGREVLRRPGRKRFRSIAEIYAVTKPIESRKMSGHNVIR